MKKFKIKYRDNIPYYIGKLYRYKSSGFPWFRNLRVIDLGTNKEIEYRIEDPNDDRNGQIERNSLQGFLGMLEAGKYETK